MASKLLVRKIPVRFLISTLIIVGFSLGLLSSVALSASDVETIKVWATPLGTSTRYIGACEGNINFDIRDLQELGINTYRIYGGMSRWEATDDDGIYGQPSIAEIRANPDAINWAWWDEIMTDPPYGSDYWWSDSPERVWQGSAETIFSSLKQAGIRPILTIRNTDNNWNPPWALQLNPPRTKEDWNEWWEHIFATVYWLNVRNDYQVNDFEIHNEPDNRDQGWGGTQSDYFEMVKVAKDAIDYVYKTYLPGRAYHIHAPTTVGGSRWPYDAIRQIPTDFDSINIHNYDADISNYTQKVHNSMKGTVHANSPLWLGEWGTYTTGYDDFSFALGLIQNMIRGSQPDNNYIYGSHIFSLYDWGKHEQYRGIIGANGKKSISYYAFRMGIRTLQGGRPIFLTTTKNPDLMAIATKDKEDKIYLLVVNSGQQSYNIDGDFSELRMNATGKMWEFSEVVRDRVIDQPTLKNGHVRFIIPAKAAILIRFE